MSVALEHPVASMSNYVEHMPPAENSLTQSALLRRVPSQQQVYHSTAVRSIPRPENIQRFSSRGVIWDFIHFIPVGLKPNADTAQQAFDLIELLYLSPNTPRDRQVAERLTTLYRDAVSEDENILIDSLRQLIRFFLINKELPTPKITLTPDGTLRARWIRGPEDFTAIEFTGKPLAKLVAEIPREQGLIARHFSSELLSNIVCVVRALGGSLF